jgi:hypothetical protein
MLLWNGKPPDERSRRLFSEAELAALGELAVPDEEKEKNRVLVRGIPRILAKGGFTIAGNSEAGK